MVKLTSYEVGKIALVILQHKMERSGIELRPNDFAQFITKNAQRIRCSQEELKEFFQKFILPRIIRGCGMDVKIEDVTPSAREAKVAFRLLKMRFFWDLSDLRGEVYGIVEKTPINFSEAAAVVTYIANRHIKDQFGEGDEIKLEFVDTPED